MALTKQRLQAIDRAVPWVPQPGPQIAAYLCEADVLGYGGAAGAGKTGLGTGLALTQHERTLFLRSEFAQLQAVIDEVALIQGSRDGWNGQDKIFRIKGKQQIRFGGLKNVGDEHRYDGDPRDLLILDEAAQIRYEQARHVMGWVRSTNKQQRCRILIMSNPPKTAEGEWLIEFFGAWLDDQHPNPAEYGELRWYAKLDGLDVEREDGTPFEYKGEMVYPQSRTFIPGRVQDNRYLRGTSYVSMLQSMDEPLRSQLLYGDFRAGREDDDWQLIKSAWVDAAMDRWTPEGRKARMDAIGVDVARGGADNTVLARRHGMWADEPIVKKGIECPNGRAVLGYIIQHQRNGATIYPDAIGPGASVVDFAEEARMHVVPMIGSAASTRMSRNGHWTFANARSQNYWNLRELLDPDYGYDVALPRSKELKRDLCAPRFTERSGKVIVESKEAVVKRLGRSTDYGDAYVNAFAEADEEVAAFLHNPAVTSRQRKPDTIWQPAWDEPLPPLPY